MSKHLKKDVRERLAALKNGNHPNSPEQNPMVQDNTKGHMPGPTQAKTQKLHQNRGNSG